MRQIPILKRLGMSLLVGALLAIIPSAILPDLIVPFDRWYDFERERAGGPKTYTLNNLPPVLEAEIAIFKWLSLPPSWVAERFGRWRTEYARLVVPDSIHTEAWPAYPPFVFAIQHLKVAMPFWTFVVFLLLHGIATLASRLQRRRARAV